MRIARQTALSLSLLVLFTATAAAAQCELPARLDRVQMFRTANGVDMVPVLIDGAPKMLLLDTGGYFSQIRPYAAEELNLPLHAGGGLMIDETGRISNLVAVVEDFTLGHLHPVRASLRVTPGGMARRESDGILAPDYLEAYDAEVDFGTDTLDLFSPDHCPGPARGWKADAAATVPIIRQGLRILVPVTLDGQPLKALLDTGTAVTALRMGAAERLFGLRPGDSGLKERGFLNGDPALAVYVHAFRNLSFKGVSVNHPAVNIIPDAMRRREEQLRPAEAGSPLPPLNADLILGMDVLRKLHIYFAFREGQMYIAPASTDTAMK